MSNRKVIPGDPLTVLTMPKGWTRKDLYTELRNFFSGEDDCEFNLGIYSKFFLKIIGTYDEKLVEEFSHCRICPYNIRYTNYHDYNELLGDKTPVLVLSSDTPDFERYDVVASYYTNRIELVEGTAVIEVKAKKKWYSFLM